MARNPALAPSGTPLLPVHQPVEGDEFMPIGWCGSCETCAQRPAEIVCAACSYTWEGHPVEPVTWPCWIARRATRIPTAFRTVLRSA